MLKPIEDRIMVKRIEEKETKTASGILIPSSAGTSPFVIVCEVGPDVENVKKGDTVIFEGEPGRSIEVGGVIYYFIRKHQVLALAEFRE